MTFRKLWSGDIRSHSDCRYLFSDSESRLVQPATYPSLATKNRIYKRRGINGDHAAVNWLRL